MNSFNFLNSLEKPIYLLAFSALLSVFLMPMVQVFPNGILEDDGYFYSQIAYNIATLGMSSFDGINITSGYHLLWGGILSLVSLIVTPFTDSKLAHLFFLILFNIIIYASVSWRMFDANMERLGAFVLFLMSSLMMETILLSALLLIISRRFLDRKAIFGNSRIDLLIIFLIPLIRIDSSVIIGVISLYFLIYNRTIFVRIIAALLLGVVVQLLTMYALFGELASVSSFLKISQVDVFQGDFQQVLTNITGSKATLVRFLAVLVLAALAAMNIRRTVERDAKFRKIALLLAILAFFVPPFVLIGSRSWYLLPVHLVLFYIATRPDIENGAARPQQALTRGFAVFICATYLAGATMYHHQYRNDQTNSANFVKNLNYLTPRGAPIYQIDGSGFIGYFSPNPLVNGDGLVNSYAYARRLRDNALAGYLEDHEICWIIDNRRNRSQGVVVDFRGLVVKKSDAKLMARVPDDGVNKHTDYRLFRLRRQDCQ